MAERALEVLVEQHGGRQRHNDLDIVSLWVREAVAILLGDSCQPSPFGRRLRDHPSRDRSGGCEHRRAFELLVGKLVE